MKALGADIVEFFESEWPDGYYVDESELSVYEHNIIDDETASILPISEKYEVGLFGRLCGAGNLSLITFYSRWAKAKTTTTLVVQVLKERELEVREMLMRAGIVAK